MLISTFEKLIYPLSVLDFQKKFYKQKAVIIKGNPDKFEDIFNWSSINQVLNTTPAFVDSASFRIFKESKPQFFKDAYDIINCTQNGSTLIVENIDRLDNKLSNFVDSLNNEIHENTRLNCYLSFPRKQGFSLHYDTHDFFIIQAEGTKRWQVYPNTIEDPLFYQKEHNGQPPLPTDMYLDCVLEKGDVLYVPKGHWHDVVTEDNPSLHLTLAIFTKTGIDFLNWLTNYLRDDVIFRKSFPITFGVKEKDNENFHLHMKHLTETLINRVNMTKNITQSFLEYVAANNQNRKPFNYPYHLIDFDIKEFKTFYFNKVHFEITEDSENNLLHVIFPSTIIKLPIICKEVIEFILDCDKFEIKDLTEFVGTIGYDNIKLIIENFIKQGIILAEK